MSSPKTLSPGNPPTALRAALAAAETPVADRLSFGSAALDATLPWGGLPAARLHEIAGAAEQGVALAFAVALLARRAADGAPPLLWGRLRRDPDRRGRPYGPGLAALGLPTARLILVEARRPTDLLWALEEALRAGLPAVLGEGVAADLTAGRRLQLAAERGGGLALLVPPAADRPSVSAATTRWRVDALPLENDEFDGPAVRWRLSLERCRGGRPAQWDVVWDHATRSFALAAELADRPLAAAAG